jgi:toxin HigB-1
MGNYHARFSGGNGAVRLLTYPVCLPQKVVSGYHSSKICCILRNTVYGIYMIKSFKHKGLRKFFKTGSVAGIQPKHKQKIRLRLTALDTATCIEDMNTPGWRLHNLTGDRKGLWAIDVNKNWRIVFEFLDGNAYVVDYEDYH